MKTFRIFLLTMFLILGVSACGETTVVDEPLANSDSANPSTPAENTESAENTDAIVISDAVSGVVDDADEDDKNRLVFNPELNNGGRLLPTGFDPSIIALISVGVAGIVAGRKKH